MLPLPYLMFINTSSRHRNDLYCVELDVKLYYTIPYHSDVSLIKLTAGTQNSIPYKTYISEFFLYFENLTE